MSLGRCEAFSTYPRTYDLLHLDGLFTAESHRFDILLYFPVVSFLYEIHLLISIMSGNCEAYEWMMMVLRMDLVGRCDMKFVLLEMDRILRPNGYTIIRESSYFVDAIASIAKGMRWGCRKEDTEYSVEKEKILVCQKKLWYSSSSSKS